MVYIARKTVQNILTHPGHYIIYSWYYRFYVICIQDVYIADENSKKKWVYTKGKTRHIKRP